MVETATALKRSPGAVVAPPPGGPPGAPPPEDKTPKYAEMGVTGLRVNSGILDEEFLRELKGERGRKVYREMSQNDATVGAVLAAIGLLIRGVKWRAEPRDESEKAKAEAEFLESVFADTSHTWEDFVAEVLTMLSYGWHYSEIVFKQRLGPEHTDPTKRSEYDDGRIGFRKLAPRGQDTLTRWELQDDGGITGMWQLPPDGPSREIFIPIERALLFRTMSRLNSPEGVSTLRTAYESWYFLKRIREYEAIGIERELAGLPIVRIPSKYTKADASAHEKALYAQYIQIARDLKFNHQGGLVIPSDFYPDKDGFPTSARQVDIELLKSAGTRTIDTVAVKNDYKRDITRAMLSDFLMLGQDKGAYNLGESKIDLFLRAIEAVMGQIAAPLNLYAIPRLWAMNGLPRETMPKWVPGKVTKADLAKLGAFIRDVTGAGMPLFPDENLEAFLRSEADLPEKSEEARLAQEEQAQRDAEAADLGLEGQRAAVDAAANPDDEAAGGAQPGKGARKPPPGAEAAPGKKPPVGKPGAKKPPFGKGESEDPFEKYDPDQPRDDDGRWSLWAGSGALTTGGAVDKKGAHAVRDYIGGRAFGVNETLRSGGALDAEDRAAYVVSIGEEQEILRQLLEDDDDVEKDFDPNQARDDHGRWTNTGAGLFDEGDEDNMLRGKHPTWGTWGASHGGSMAFSRSAAEAMGIPGYSEEGGTLYPNGHRGVRVFLRSIHASKGSTEPLYHGFQNVKNIDWKEGDTLKLPLTATSGELDGSAGYGINSTPGYQKGPTTVFEFPKGTPMAGYSRWGKEDRVEFKHKWSEAIVAGEFEIAGVRQTTQYGWKDGRPITVVRLKPKATFDPDAKKWVPHG